MFNRVKSVALMAALIVPMTLICPAPISAAIPPLSAEQRLQNSTFVITATVVSLQTNNVGVKIGGYDILTTAKVRVESVEKGQLDAGKTIEVHYRQTGKRPKGWTGPQGQNQALKEGEMVRLFLDETFGAYHLLSPNGWEALPKPKPEPEN